MKTPRTPKLEYAELLTHGMKARGLTAKDVANGLKWTPAAVQTYRAGTRLPKYPDKLAEFVWPEDEVRRRAFIEAVERHREPLLDQVHEKNRVLKISTTAFGPIASALPDPQERGARGLGFVDSFFLRFLRLSGVKWERVDRPNPDIQHDLQKGDVDLVLNHLGSVDRSLWARFWFLPIRISLGAVGLSSHLADATVYDGVQRFLTGPKNSDVPRIRLLVLKGSVAHAYCTQTLQLRQQDVTVLPHRDLSHYFHKLKAADPSEGIPILFDDEGTILEFLADPTLNQDRELLPIMPLTTARAIAQYDVRLRSTYYVVSISCGRRKSDLWDFLDDALKTLLITEGETTAIGLADLYGRLQRMAMNAAFTFPDLRAKEDCVAPARAFWEGHLWATNALMLNRRAVWAFGRTAPHWEPVLNRTRELVHDRLARETEFLTELVVSERKEFAPPLALARIEQTCDVELPLSSVEFAKLESAAVATILSGVLSRDRT